MQFLSQHPSPLNPQRGDISQGRVSTLLQLRFRPSPQTPTGWYIPGQGVNPVTPHISSPLPNPNGVTFPKAGCQPCYPPHIIPSPQPQRGDITQGRVLTLLPLPYHLTPITPTGWHYSPKTNNHATIIIKKLHPSYLFHPWPNGFDAKRSTLRNILLYFWSLIT